MPTPTKHPLRESLLRDETLASATLKIFSEGEKTLGQGLLGINHRKKRDGRTLFVANIVRILDEFTERKEDAGSQPATAYADDQYEYEFNSGEPRHKERRFLWACVTTLPIVNLAMTVGQELPARFRDGDTIRDAESAITTPTDRTEWLADFSIRSMRAYENGHNQPEH